MIRFHAKTALLISGDLAGDVLAIRAEEGFERPGVIVDGSVAGNPLVGELLDGLGRVADIDLRVIPSSEPTTSLVDRETAYFRGKKRDFFIGIGGGSTMDLAKAVSAMVVNPGLVEEYHGTGKPVGKVVPKMMIPTTAGTGSEVTPGAVLLNEKTAFKRGLSSPLITPEYALLHAPLTVSMPGPVTASTGMDALGHAIESYSARNASEVTRMYSLEAFRLIVNNLHRVFGDPANLVLRERILLGATLAGYAIHNSNTGAAHSLAYPAGIYHGVPHGLAVALILPRVVKINVEKGCTAYARLYDCIDARDRSITGDAEKSVAFSELLAGYGATRFLGRDLGKFGVNEANYAFLAERGLDLTPALSNNPVEFTLEDSKRVYRDLLPGT